MISALLELSLPSDFPDLDSAAMPKTADQRLQSIEEQQNRHSDRLAAIETHLAVLEERTGPKSNPLRVAIISLVATALIAYLAWLGNAVVGQGNNIAEIKQAMVTQGLRIAAINPQNPDSAQRVKDALAEAQKTRIKIPQAAIREVGQKLVEASNASPQAWDAALELISYRSSTLNTSNIGAELLFDVPSGKACLASKDGGQAAVVANETLTSKNGCTVDLSVSALWRNVVFRNMTIVYSGKPTILENVWFINCTFRMQPSPPARELGQVLLASNAATVKLP